jgi:hypothetical protein
VSYQELFLEEEKKPEIEADLSCPSGWSFTSLTHTFAYF